MSEASCNDSSGPDWPKPKIGGGLRHKFSKQEDDTLRRIVLQHGEGNWSTIAACMKNRTARQCRERYKNYLSPRIKNDPWTREEEQLLELKYAELGPKWAKIALFFESRSDVNVKNHWAAMVNRQNREKLMHQEKAEMFARADGCPAMVPLVPVFPGRAPLVAMYPQVPLRQVPALALAYPPQLAGIPVYPVHALYHSAVVSAPAGAQCCAAPREALPPPPPPKAPECATESVTECAAAPNVKSDAFLGIGGDDDFKGFESSADSTFEYDTTFDTSFDLFDSF